MLEKQSAEHLRELSEMAINLAHEIRNPLASIRASAQRIEQKISTNSIPESKYVHFIISEVDRLERFIRDFLQNMHIFTQPQKPNFQTVELNQLLEEIVNSQQEEIEQKQVKTVKNFDPSIPKVCLDPQLLTYAFLNLIKNVLDALSDSRNEKKELCLSTRLNHGYLEIKITDNGPGIPEEIREKIFQPLFTTKSKRMGLGLTVCQKIVQAHQGKIFLEDSPRDNSLGATFVIQLPIKEEVA